MAVGTQYGDWYLGLGIGFAIIVVVVILVAMILTYASRINEQARAAIGALEQVRANTQPLWEIKKTNASALAILAGAKTARAALTGQVAPAAPAPAASGASGSAASSKWGRARRFRR